MIFKEKYHDITKYDSKDKAFKQHTASWKKQPKPEKNLIKKIEKSVKSGDYSEVINNYIELLNENPYLTNLWRYLGEIFIRRVFKDPEFRFYLNQVDIITQNGDGRLKELVYLVIPAKESLFLITSSILENGLDLNPTLNEAMKIKAFNIWLNYYVNKP